MSANKHLGEVAFNVGTHEYIVRLGILEVAALETAFDVEGIGRVFSKGYNPDDRESYLRLAAAALERHHPTLTEKTEGKVPENKLHELADIIDWRDRDESGKTYSPLARALLEAFQFSLPEQDPNATPATTTETKTSESTPSE